MNHKELSKLITDVEEWRLQHHEGTAQHNPEFNTTEVHEVQN